MQTRASAACASQATSGEDCANSVVYVDAIVGLSAGLRRRLGVRIHGVAGCDRPGGRARVLRGLGRRRACHPTAGVDRGASFQLREYVALYGGFAGDEHVRDERDIAARPTTLSGDIGVEGEATDNSFHVVYGADKAILSGFRIASGHAVRDDGEWDFRGGGMVNDGVSPVIEDCEFAFNVAEREGGAMFNVGTGDGRGPKIVRTRFVNNNAGRRGGAIMNDGAYPRSSSRFWS